MGPRFARLCVPLGSFRNRVTQSLCPEHLRRIAITRRHGAAVQILRSARPSRLKGTAHVPLRNLPNRLSARTSVTVSGSRHADLPTCAAGSTTRRLRCLNCAHCSLRNCLHALRFVATPQFDVTTHPQSAEDTRLTAQQWLLVQSITQTRYLCLRFFVE